MEPTSTQPDDDTETLLLILEWITEQRKTDQEQWEAIHRLKRVLRRVLERVKTLEEEVAALQPPTPHPAVAGTVNFGTPVKRS